MFDTINEKSYLLFLTHDNCCFSPAVTFDGSGNFSLTITDHQGQIWMGVFSVFTLGKECALMLLRILAALMYGSLSDVGLDPSMKCDDEGNVKTIIINKKELTVFRRIHALQALIGRGTKVWIVTQEDQYYILKDSWVQSG
jgi:Fungal protein kinase